MISHDRSHRDLRRKSYQDIIPTAAASETDTSESSDRKRKRRRSSISSVSENGSGSEFAPDKESEFEDDEEVLGYSKGKAPLVDDDEEFLTDDIDESGATAAQDGQVIAIQDDGNEALFQVIFDNGLSKHSIAVAL